MADNNPSPEDPIWGLLAEMGVDKTNPNAALHDVATPPEIFKNTPSSRRIDALYAEYKAAVTEEGARWAAHLEKIRQDAGLGAVEAPVDKEEGEVRDPRVSETLEKMDKLHLELLGARFVEYLTCLRKAIDIHREKVYAMHRGVGQTNNNAGNDGDSEAGNNAGEADNTVSNVDDNVDNSFEAITRGLDAVAAALPDEYFEE